ncbi:hypothetical protein ACFV3R_14250 [Streptomyces sp. NPDC059740]|uniref:hypothetical protein n=1 Tax=Streptomyces sp. NPDC059740 TaxID=3346926 RepID=UPI00365CB073
MDITAAPLRAARAALFTALCLTLSTASHVLLSRTPLPLTVVAALGVAVFALAYRLAGRERGFGRIAALLVPLELAADTVFSGGQHTCYGPAGGPVTGPLRSMGVHLLCGGGDVGSPLAKLPADPTAVQGPTSWLALLVAHVTVALLAAAWLRRGEAALVGLVRATAGFAFRPLLVAVAAARTAAGRLPVRPPRFRSAAGAPSSPTVLVHSVVRRGPPRSLLAA